MRSDICAILLTLASAFPASAGVIDDFTSVRDWVADPSDGVELNIGTDAGIEGAAMRLDFDFHGGAGYAIARRALVTPMPDDYEVSFYIRGEAPPNTLEIKLLDPSGESVWWVNRRHMIFPDEWTRLRLKKRHFEFAWGPSQGAPLTAISAIEIVVTASSGGRGTVWIDQLRLDALAPRPATYPHPIARTGAGRAAMAAVDDNLATEWTSDGSEPSDLVLDFGSPREIGGLTLHWSDGRHALDYDVETSDDLRQWFDAASVRGSRGGSDPLYMPDTDARYVRLRMLRGAADGFALREIAIEPLEFSQSRNAFVATLAARGRRGLYPRYFYGEQSYWTIVGEPGSEREILINTDGGIEVDASSFTLEPFLYVDDRLITWNDVESRPALADGDLPVPSVEWTTPRGAPTLNITAFAHGDAMYARYRLRNTSPAPVEATLFLAMRPFQVNPSWQFLNIQGGVSRIEEVSLEGSTLTAGGRRVIALTPAQSAGASTLAAGGVVELLDAGMVPPEDTASDPSGAASAALQWTVGLPPGGEQDVWIMLPGSGPASVPSSARAAELLDESIRSWRSRLVRFDLSLPGDASRVADVVRSNVAYILINQDGGAIQPGSRSYDRSWIRDGSLTSAALLRLGYVDPVRHFIDWFAPYQFPSGKVPCCVDSRGADPVPEHDSSGELIFLLAEYFRHTKDLETLERHWPRVQLAVEWIESLVAQRSTPEYASGEKRAYYGLVPESISHEGYSAKPMHSYWDDFFTLRGLEDAALIASVLDHDEEEAAYSALAATFRTNLFASLAAARRMHGIDFLPGSVELGDFDATSTTIALAPGGLAGDLDPDALAATFDRYWAESLKRMNSETWEAYTPYETRTIGSFVRLGQRERAITMLEWLMKDLRPAEWNHWAEVVFRDPATPKFIGDMPHTWVGSDFIRSVLDMFAYEEDDALVVAHGVPDAWTRGEGLMLRGLRTHFGIVDLRMRRDGDVLTIDIGGSARPPGGVILRPDAAWAASAENGGDEVTIVDGAIRIDSIPATITLSSGGRG